MPRYALTTGGTKISNWFASIRGLGGSWLATVLVSKRKWAMLFGVIAVALAAGCGSDSGHESSSAASFSELRASDSEFYPLDISADGSTVVGAVEGVGSLLWQHDTGFVEAGTLVGDPSAVLNGVSRDGRVVVGGSGDRAFRWTRAQGTVWLPTIDGQPSSAYAVSADGRVTIGESAFEPVIWIEDGAARRLASGSDEGAYRAHAVSANGRAVAGIIFGETRRPFRWQASTRIVDLGDAPARIGVSLRLAISGDGRTVCGPVTLDAHLGRGSRIAASPGCLVYSVPFCWTATTGIAVLPQAPFEPEMDTCPNAGVDNQLVGVSHDGTIVVGSIDDRERGQVALRWDAGAPQAISDLLAEQGIDLAGWHLMHASGVSADGETIVGTGVSPDGARSAWIAVVPRSPRAAGPPSPLAPVLPRRSR